MPRARPAPPPPPFCRSAEWDEKHHFPVDTLKRAAELGATHDAARAHSRMHAACACCSVQMRARLPSCADACQRITSTARSTLQASVACM